MARIQLNHNQGVRWHQAGRVSAKGYLFDAANRLVQGDDLARFFESVRTSDQLSDLLKSVNGFFAVIIQTETHLLAAVDRIRSFPLFHSRKKGEWIISDDADYLRFLDDPSPFDETSTLEFLLTGYVTNEQTLDPTISQIRAGEIFELNLETGDIRKKRYYLFRHTEDEIDPDAKIEALNRVMESVFERLIRFLNGRQAVIPLSGGNDSRMLAQMLKRAGYENVICFTYGYRWHWEVIVSHRVARSLNYPWIFIPFTRRKRYDWFRLPERMAYYRYGSHYTSIAHMQDWPAVMLLKEQGRIAPDAVIIPGHSGDFIGGSHLPLRFEKRESMTDAELRSAIYIRHFNLRDWSNEASWLEPRLAEKINAALHPDPVMDVETAADLFEWWDWQERQAKYINNSVRVYEFWGYAWSMPFWDNALLEFWQTVPFEWRLDKKLYNRHVHKHHPAPIHIPTVFERKIWHVVNRFTDVRYGRLTGDRSLVRSWLTKYKEVLPGVEVPFLNPDELVLRTRINGVDSLLHIAELQKLEK
jgi:asparagine synthase (glutamine-hydrolysing)